VTSETKKVNPLHRTSEKMKVVSASGELVEPHTPPGLPPYLKPGIKRPIIKKRYNKLNKPL
jgi:hypothetical protein